VAAPDAYFSVDRPREGWREPRPAADQTELRADLALLLPFAIVAPVVDPDMEKKNPADSLADALQVHIPIRPRQTGMLPVDRLNALAYLDCVAGPRFRKELQPR